MSQILDKTDFTDDEDDVHNSKESDASWASQPFIVESSSSDSSEDEDLKRSENVSGKSDSDFIISESEEEATQLLSYLKTPSKNVSKSPFKKMVRNLSQGNNNMLKSNRVGSTIADSSDEDKVTAPRSLKNRLVIDSSEDEIDEQIERSSKNLSVGKNVSKRFSSNQKLAETRAKTISSSEKGELIPSRTPKSRNLIESSEDEDDQVSAVPKLTESKSTKISRNDDEEVTPSKTNRVRSIIEHSSGEDHQIEQLSEQLDRSALADDFNEDEVQGFANSTPYDAELPRSALNPRLSSISVKRLLNRSADTPRILKQIKESDSPRDVSNFSVARTPRPEVPNFSSDEDVIEVSSGEESLQPTQVNKTPRQTTLNAFVKNAPKVASPQVFHVTFKGYQEQQDKVSKIETEVQNAARILKTVNLEYLPDKGQAIRQRHTDLETKLLEEVKKLSKMKVTQAHQLPATALNAKDQAKVLTWDEIEAKARAVQPKTFGKQAMSTYNAQKALTMDRLQQLHGSLKTCPTENDRTDDPKGLKVELMTHQKHALVWMMWREKQKPSGGILADDMGLGKTLTMISLLMKTLEDEKDDSGDSDSENAGRVNDKPNGGTLVICPASLINQWSSEVDHKTKRGLISYDMYHGSKRETKPKRLARHDMVITTYAIVNNECDKMGTVFRVRWKRIIIDEAHQIRNHKSATSEAVCKLPAKSRWALTGTPVHNKELDMYALLKYLKCSPFDDIQVWRRWVGDKSTGGQERLHTVISSLMLRRTKAELVEKGTLNSLPDRKWELIPVQLSKPELDVYNRILIFSRTLFAQFLHQKAEKKQDALDIQMTATAQPNQEYFKMRQKLLRLNKVKDIKQHEILVLLLRLRQICCHPSLIVGMLHEDIGDIADDDDDGDAGEHKEELDLLEQLNKLEISDDEYNPNSSHLENGDQAEGAGLKEAARGLLNPNNPIFSKKIISSKIKVMLKVLQEKVLNGVDKAIVVSQWSSYLNLISYHFKKEAVCFAQLDGSVPVNKRMEMVDHFNNPKSKVKVLLLSLTAGGVGLNLVGGNHLFLLDLHWNPQLENQAQDRIYRVGQTKPVFIYKFMATDTIEKRILDLQEKKLAIANSMLTGSKQIVGNKLSLQDLKMLFDM